MYSYSEIVDELLKEFPEIIGRYAEELSWIRDTFQDQETRGETIYFDRCFCDYIGRLLVSERQDNVRNLVLIFGAIDLISAAYHFMLWNRNGRKCMDDDDSRLFSDWKSVYRKWIVPVLVADKI